MVIGTDLAWPTMSAQGFPTNKGGRYCGQPSLPQLSQLSQRTAMSNVGKKLLLPTQVPTQVRKKNKF